MPAFPFPAGAVTPAVAEQAVRALSAVHDCGGLQGDIRPENILVGRHGGQDSTRPSVCILDFASSRGFASLEEWAKESRGLRAMLVALRKQDALLLGRIGS